MSDLEMTARDRAMTVRIAEKVRGWRSSNGGFHPPTRNRNDPVQGD